MSRHAIEIEQFRQAAHELHQSVNQTYGPDLPYGFHLDMVADSVREFGHLVCACENDLFPMFFEAYYHDAIEDARQTYNDIMHRARMVMTEEQALMATEIVYALTNEKGRDRAERANEKYYKGIRQTPYAPFLKLCDRMANVSFSCSPMSGRSDSDHDRMKKVYKSEMGHFLQAINAHSDDLRLRIPKDVVLHMAEFLIDDMEREERELAGWFGETYG
jgi:hypothetical protein